MTIDEARGLTVGTRVEIVPAAVYPRNPPARGSVAAKPCLHPPEDDEWWKEARRRNPLMYPRELKVPVKLDEGGEVHHLYPEYVRKLGLLELIAEAAV